MESRTFALCLATLALSSCGSGGPRSAPPAPQPRWVALGDADGAWLVRFDDVEAPSETPLSSHVSDGTLRSAMSWSPSGQRLAYVAAQDQSDSLRLYVASLNQDWASESVSLGAASAAALTWMNDEALLAAISPLESSSPSQILRVDLAESMTVSTLAEGSQARVWSQAQGTAFLLADQLSFLRAGRPAQPVSDEHLLLQGWQPSSEPVVASDPGAPTDYPEFEFCQRLYFSPDGKLAAGCARPNSAATTVALSGDLRLGHIRLPGGPSDLVLHDDHPHGNLTYTSEPVALRWAPQGSLVAYVMSNYPPRAASCPSKTLVIADVLSEETLSLVPLSCGDSRFAPLQFAFEDENHLLFVRRQDEPNPVAELYRVAASQQPVLLARFDEAYPLLLAAPDGTGVFLLTQDLVTDRHVIRYAPLEALDAGLSIVASGSGSIEPYPLRLSDHGTTLIYGVQEGASCRANCRGTFALKPSATPRLREGKVHEIALGGLLPWGSSEFVASSGIASVNAEGLVFRSTERLDVAIPIRTTRPPSWLSAPTSIDLP